MNPVRMITIVILLMPLAGCQTFGSKALQPFTTDGCSDFPNGTSSHKDLWRKCCVAHDLKYWAGGTFDERLQADLDLRACVKAVGEPGVAQLMLAGVRVGGSPMWPTSFRWGYGWAYFRGYRALTPEELRQVDRQKALQGIN